jgi:hypothetical protein
MATTTDTRSAGTITTGLGGRTLIVKIAKTNLTSSELTTILTSMAQGGTHDNGTSDPFTIAGVATANGTAFQSGVTDEVFVALQGTGTFSANSSDAYGVGSAATTIEAVFVQKA